MQPSLWIEAPMNMPLQGWHAQCLPGVHMKNVASAHRLIPAKLHLMAVHVPLLAATSAPGEYVGAGAGGGGGAPSGVSASERPGRPADFAWAHLPGSVDRSHPHECAPVVAACPSALGSLLLLMSIIRQPCL